MNNAITVGTKIRLCGDFSNDPRTGEVVADIGSGFLSIRWSDGSTGVLPAALIGTVRCRVVS